MKKLIINFAIVTIAIITMVAIMAFRAGVQHAIYDSKVDVRGNYVFIDLDGDVYVHTTEGGE